MTRKMILAAVLLALVSIGPFALIANAQGGSGVYVTTQDFSSLRAGPDILFERLIVLDPSVTLRAVGRTVDTMWVQVDYDGTLGWINRNLLVWSGDITALPVDGINTQPFVRRVRVTGVTIRDTRLYYREVSPFDVAGELPAGTEVELTSRLGSRGFFRYQIRHEGQLYWVGSWDILVTSGNYMSLLDASYLYPYGRLVGVLTRDISNTLNRLGQIEDIWLRLNAGERVSCGFVPSYVRRRAADVDVARERIFAPMIVSLDSAIGHVNAAIAAFEDACGRPDDDFYLTQQEVRAALDELAQARRDLVLANSLIGPLGLRDPLIDSTGQLP